MISLLFCVYVTHEYNLPQKMGNEWHFSVMETSLQSRINSDIASLLGEVK